MLPPPPPWATLCWLSDTAIHVELPCTDGTYYRQSYPLSESGLSRALNVLRTRKPTVPPPDDARTIAKARAQADATALLARIGLRHIA